jgi:hypothetical protein
VKFKNVLKQMKMKTQQNQWDTAKTVVRGMFTEINDYIKKKKKK